MTEIPARGLLPNTYGSVSVWRSSTPNDRNPRQGITTGLTYLRRLRLFGHLQMTEIPARGLLRNTIVGRVRLDACLQMTEIPARGLLPAHTSRCSGKGRAAPNDRNPRQGITTHSRLLGVWKPQRLQMTEIPARGLLQLDGWALFKGRNPPNDRNPRQGITTHARRDAADDHAKITPNDRNPRQETVG